MTIKKLVIASAMTLILTATANAKVNLRYEFCGDKYCGQYEVKPSFKKKVQKASRKLAHKVKKSEPRIAAPKPIEPTANQLIAKAMVHLGTNPTGWARLWCGRFMAMIAPEAAKRIPNPNLARNWAKLPKTAPQIGSIAVLARGNGGHVGIVIGFDSKGNPKIISGDHNRKVAIAYYPKHRVIAYVTV